MPAFQSAFAGLIETAYSSLFGIYQEETWNLTEDKLISFFRQADQSSGIVGARQAKTFKTLAIYVGRTVDTVSSPKPKMAKKVDKTSASTTSKKSSAKTVKDNNPLSGAEDGFVHARNVGLTVRIEVNLPSTGDQEVYDKIFRSIREHLLNG
jgi:hypothetical protein